LPSLIPSYWKQGQEEKEIRNIFLFEVPGKRTQQGVGKKGVGFSGTKEEGKDPNRIFRGSISWAHLKENLKFTFGKGQLKGRI